MRNLLQLACLLIVPANAAASDGVVVIQGDKAPLNTAPTFNHGYLATYGADGIAMYGPSGSPAMSIPRPPDGSLRNADMEPDGSAAVAVSRNAARYGGIWVFSPQGARTGEIVTSPFRPAQVCFAPDHSIWVLGDEDHLPENERTNYSLLRHYSRAGELLGEFFPRSSFPAHARPAAGHVGGWMLRIAGGRIGVKLMGAAPGKRLLWLEADLDGKETGRWTAPYGGEPVAMTASGVVYAQAGDAEITVLDRASGTWKPVPQSSNDRLMGAEGDTLVFSIHGTNAYRRAAQP